MRPWASTAGWCLLAIAAAMSAACGSQEMRTSDTATVERQTESLSMHGGSRGALWLVHMGTVAQELGLRPDQRAQFAAWVEQLRAEIRKAARGQLGAGDDPASQQRMAEKQRQIDALTDQFHRQVVAELDDRQRVRLDELYLRFVGPFALLEPHVAARLEVSAAQQQALRDAVSAASGAWVPDDLLKVLSDPQRQEWKNLQGRPFEFPQPRQFQRAPGVER